MIVLVKSYFHRGNEPVPTKPVIVSAFYVAESSLTITWDQDVEAGPNIAFTEVTGVNGDDFLEDQSGVIVFVNGNQTIHPLSPVDGGTATRTFAFNNFVGGLRGVNGKLEADSVSGVPFSQ